MIHHIGVFASDFAASRRFYAAALAAGGIERHAPRHWPEYRGYCAFVSDPDGNNIEAVHKEV
jgi:catechol 2,3-dioxygenase-like lactoylglutathione lyase family enzyme